MALKIIIWNVAHGNAISIITPNKTRIVQDLGANGSNDFSPILYSHNHKKYAVNKYHALIITHPHRDHIDDIINFSELQLEKGLHHFIRPMSLNRKFYTAQFLSRGAPSETDKLKVSKYFDLHEKFPNTYITKKSPLNPDNNGGVEFSFFKPKNTNNINNHSIVTIIKYQGKSILLSGDNEIPSWRELLKSSKFKNKLKEVDIFLASHHGRKNGYYPELFKYLKPKLVIISDGPKIKTSAIRDYFKHVEDSFGAIFNDQENIKKRKCLTTRKDKAITLNINSSNVIKIKTSS